MGSTPIIGSASCAPDVRAVLLRPLAQFDSGAGHVAPRPYVGSVPYKDPQKRREMQVNYQRRHIAKPGEMTKQVTRVAARQTEMRDWVRTIKSSLQCERCGEDRAQTFDIHHRDSAIKAFTVMEGYKMGISQEAILAEIEKCEVICSNCHRVEHAKW